MPFRFWSASSILPSAMSFLVVSTWCEAHPCRLSACLHPLHVFSLISGPVIGYEIIL